MEIPVNDDDVIYLDSSVSFTSHSTEKASEITRQAKAYLGNRNNNYGHWLGDGADAELLQPGSQWQKGKLVYKLFFIPDEPEPPNTPDPFK